MSAELKINSNSLTGYVISHTPIPVVDRNRNYEPILSSVKLVVKQSYPNAILVGQSFEMLVSTVGEYRGTVLSVLANTNNRTVDVEIEHKLAILTRLFVDKTETGGILFSLNTVDFSSPTTVDSAIYDTGVTDENYIYIAAGHGLSSFDKVGFKLPADEDYELIGQRYFYAYPEVPSGGGGTSAQWARLRGAPSLSSEFDYNEDISTDLSNSVMSTTIDITLYNHFDIDNLPNFNIKHLFDSFAHLAGTTFDYTDVSSYVIHTIDGNDYTLEELCLDARMFYALGQSAAVPADVIEESSNVGSAEDDYYSRRSPLSSVFLYLMSLFGFSLHYIGSDTYEILQPSNTLYSFLPKEFYSKKYKTVNGQPDTAFGKESFADRDNYTVVDPATSSPYTLDEGYQWDAVLNGRKNNKNSVRYLANLKILLRENTSDVATSGSGLSIYYFRIDQSAVYRADAIQNDYEIQEIQSPIKTGTDTIKRNRISQSLSTGQRSIIIQEDEI